MSFKIASPNLRNYPCCLIWLCSDVFMSTVSIWHLCSISFERFYCVVFPLKFMYKRKKRVKTLIFLSWLSGFLTTLPLFIMATIDNNTIYKQQEVTKAIENNTLIESSLLTNNSIDFSTDYLFLNETLITYEMNCNYHNVYFSILSILFSFWIPLVTMLTFTFITIGVLHKSKDKLEPNVKLRFTKIKTKQQSISLSTENNNNNNTLQSNESKEFNEISKNKDLVNNNNQEKKKLLNNNNIKYTHSIKKHNNICKETEAQRRSLIVLIAFIIGYTPLFTLITISWFTPFEFSPHYFNILTWLGYLSSALNPSLYAWMNRNIKKSLLLVITCKSSFSPLKRP